MHFTAVFGQQRRIPEQTLERSFIGQHRALCQQAVEPVAELAGEALGNPVGWIPLLPIITVNAVVHRAKADDARVQPRVAHVGDARHWFAAMVARNFHLINVGAMGGVTVEILPSSDGAFFQFCLTADDAKAAALVTFVDGQRQAVIPLFADHPIVHVSQPIHFAVMPKAGIPVDLVNPIHDLIAQTGRFFRFRHLFARFVVQFAHADEPLIHQSIDQLFAATPAVRVAMAVPLFAVVDLFFVQAVEDVGRDAVNGTA